MRRTAICLLIFTAVFVSLLTAHFTSSVNAMEPTSALPTSSAASTQANARAAASVNGRTWYLDNVRFDSGAYADGSFHYDPTVGPRGTFSDIKVQVYNPDGTVNDYQIVNPFSGGNERYISFVAASGGDLTGAPYLALTPVMSMTNFGGYIDILPGPQDLSYQGVCSRPDCGPASEPYEEVLPGARIMAGPQIWYVQDVVFDSGATASGTFKYDPGAGRFGTYSDINVKVFNPNGTVNHYTAINEFSGGNDRYISLVAPSGSDQTGDPYLAMTPAISMTYLGGAMDILPGPQWLSYQGVCSQANCGPASAPYEEILSGRIVSNPGPQTWYLEGVRTDSGATINGSYKFDPPGGRFGNYTDIDIQMNNVDGTVYDFQITNPFSGGNDKYISIVAAPGGDLTGAPFIAMTPAMSMTNVSGPINILPGPQALSYFGFCAQADCGPADGPYQEIVAGRITRFVAPPTIVSNATVSVTENLTSVIDVNTTDNLDSEGNGLLFSISGSVDQTLFNIDANTGVVTFISAPDYENPADAGADNVYNVQVTVTDLGGRTAVQDIAVTVTDEVEDMMPPTASPTFDPPANAAGWHNADVTITWNWTDEPDGSGIDPDSCDLTSTLTGEGSLARVGQCADLAGNLGLQGSGSVQIDKTAPVANPTFDPPANAAGWHNADVTITWNWTDATSGIDPSSCELTSTLTGEGSLARVGQCADLAGNPGLQGSGSVQIDKTAPETTITSNPAANSSSVDATFIFTGSDALSTVASFECSIDDGTIGFGSPCTSPQDYTSLASGTYTFTVFAVDVAGNVDPTPANYTWTIEPNAAPVISSSAAISMAENQTISIDVQATDDRDSEGNGLTFSFDGGTDDALFNIDANTGIVTFKTTPDFENPSDFGADNNYEIAVSVVDADGAGAVQQLTITVTAADETAPTANPTFSPAANQAGWHNSDVTVHFNWVDNAGGSGVNPNACNITSTVTTEGTSIIFGGGCQDYSSNTGTTTGSLLIDKTAPTTTLESTPPITSSGSVTFTFSGNDALSGVGGFRCTIDNGMIGVGDNCSSPHNVTGLAAGTYTFTVQAVDVAGNADSSPVSFSWTVESNSSPTAVQIASLNAQYGQGRLLHAAWVMALGIATVSACRRRLYR